MRILIAEDDAIIADGLTQSLRHSGYAVDCARTGSEADAALAVGQYDLVILDLGLPKLNGYEAARKIRQMPRGSEVLLVALTGWGQQEDRRKSQEAGFDHHLVKPVDPAAVIKLVASVAAAQG